jgi:uncharacterized protein (TIGR00290 family)
MSAFIGEQVANGVEAMAFGDLYLEDIRAYREQKLAGTGLTPIFPLWRRATAELAENMIARGLEALIAVVDPSKLDSSFAGRAFDHALLADLPAGVDPCGENGEFHTCVTASPMFSSPLKIDVGETVLRDGFAFADLKLA